MYLLICTPHADNHLIPWTQLVIRAHRAEGDRFKSSCFQPENTPAEQLEILELIKGLKTEEGIGVIAVFHDLNIAARFCTRLLLVHKGRILSTGAPKDVLTLENVKRVYNVDARISHNRDTNSIQITPLSVASAHEEAGT